MHINSSILLIGSGRLAQHLQQWNRLLDQPNHLTIWDRKQEIKLLNDYLENAGMIWLAISDSAIISFYENFLTGFKHKIVHFSGALNDDRFYCAHPLMSFPHNMLPDETYNKIHFVISGCTSLKQAMPNFTNSYSQLEDDDKSYYHALCVLAGNFPQLLWNDISQQMKKLNLPPEALDLYIKQITLNYLELKEKAITGPLIRKDYVTIEKNLNSLNQSQKLKSIYTALTKEYL